MDAGTSTGLPGANGTLHNLGWQCQPWNIFEHYPKFLLNKLNLKKKWDQEKWRGECPETGLQNYTWRIWRKLSRDFKSACLNAYITSWNYVYLCDTLRVHYRQATISSVYWTLCIYLDFLTYFSGIETFLYPNTYRPHWVNLVCLWKTNTLSEAKVVVGMGRNWRSRGRDKCNQNTLYKCMEISNNKRLILKT